MYIEVNKVWPRLSCRDIGLYILIPSAMMNIKADWSNFKRLFGAPSDLWLHKVFKVNIRIVTEYIDVYHNYHKSYKPSNIQDNLFAVCCTHIPGISIEPSPSYVERFSTYAHNLEYGLRNHRNILYPSSRIVRRSVQSRIILGVGVVKKAKYTEQREARETWKISYIILFSWKKSLEGQMAGWKEYEALFVSELLPWSIVPQPKLSLSSLVGLGRVSLR